MTHYLLIYENDTIGHISFCIGRNTDGEPAIAYPKQMHIKEDFQRRGVGTKIIETAASQVSVVFAADQGASEIPTISIIRRKG